MKNQKLFISNIGDLAEAQRASYFAFLSSGITEEISQFVNPFVSIVRIDRGIELNCLVYLSPYEVRIKIPQTTLTDCFERDLSYTIEMYVGAEYCYPIDESKDFVDPKKLANLKEKYQLKEGGPQTRVKQDIFLGEIPLMTEEGTFVISGCERIVISQIIRSPGIYFRKEFGTSTTIYTATIISNKDLSQNS